MLGRVVEREPAKAWIERERQPPTPMRIDVSSLKGSMSRSRNAASVVAGEAARVRWRGAVRLWGFEEGWKRAELEVWEV